MWTVEETQPWQKMKERFGEQGQKEDSRKKTYLIMEWLINYCSKNEICIWVNKFVNNLSCCIHLRHNDDKKWCEHSDSLLHVQSQPETSMIVSS
jgi:hypothetical protein